LRSNFQIPIFVGLIVACFAANSVITRYLVLAQQVSPFLVTVLRFVSGFLMLLVLTRIKPAFFRPDKPDRSYLVAAFFLGAYAFSISYGYLFISVGAGTFIFYTFVVVTMGTYSVILEKERLTFRLVLGELFGLLGVLVITFGGISAVKLPGVLLMAATGAFWGLYSVYGRRFQVAFSYTYNSFLVFGAFAILASIALGFTGALNSVTISLPDLGLALYLGMVSTALSYVLWNETLKKVSASLGGLVQLAVPVIAPAMGIILLGEHLTLTLVVGGGLVLVGIYLAGSRRK
jgi:drug/metabolite transporter (DMT)-like permease